MDLKELGWNENLSSLSKKKDITDLIPGRVSTHSGKHYVVITQDGEHNAIIPNSFLNSISKKSDIPTVGDWVGLEKNPEINRYYIRFVFPRKNKLSRKVAGTKSEEQIIASNIDIVFIMTSADSDFNVRRLERYLSTVYEINAQPVIIINKIDKTKDFEKRKNQTAFRVSWSGRFRAQIHRLNFFKILVFMGIVGNMKMGRCCGWFEKVLP